MDAQPLRIGALAKAAGVGIETIRYYQRRGLVGTPSRPLGGQRSYPPDFVERVQFIKRAQSLGFTLTDVATLLRLNDGVDHRRARTLAAARLAEIDARLADLGAMRSVLARLVHDCERGAGRIPCPIIGALHAHREPRAGARERRQR